MVFYISERLLRAVYCFTLCSAVEGRTRGSCDADVFLTGLTNCSLFLQSQSRKLQDVQRLCLLSLHDYNHRCQVKKHKNKTKQKWYQQNVTPLLSPTRSCPPALPILRIVQSAVLKSTGVQQE